MTIKVVFDKEGNYTMDDDALREMQLQEELEWGEEKLSEENQEEKQLAVNQSGLEKIGTGNQKNKQRVKETKSTKKEVTALKSIVKDDMGKTKEPKNKTGAVSAENTQNASKSFLKLDAFLSEIGGIRDEFALLLLQKMHVFLCSPATRHTVSAAFKVHGVVPLDANKIIVHCCDAALTNDTIFLFDISDRTMADIEYEITQAGILMSNGRMICSLKAIPNEC